MTRLQIVLAALLSASLGSTSNAQELDTRPKTIKIPEKFGLCFRFARHAKRHQQAIMEYGAEWIVELPRKEDKKNRQQSFLPPEYTRQISIRGEHNRAGKWNPSLVSFVDMGNRWKILYEDKRNSRKNDFDDLIIDVWLSQSGHDCPNT